jgi:hypothetical protein
MKRNSQRRIRQAWMRKFRRAKEGRGYRLHRTSPISGKRGDTVVTYPGKLYILKDDGRTVAEIKDDETGRVTFQVVMNKVGSALVGV